MCREDRARNRGLDLSTVASRLRGSMVLRQATQSKQIHAGGKRNEAPENKVGEAFSGLS